MYKQIVTHKWGNNPTNDQYTSSNCFIIEDRNYDKSFAAYAKLVKLAKKDFPELQLLNKDIECCEILNSASMKGCAYIRFSVPANKQKIRYVNRIGQPYFG